MNLKRGAKVFLACREFPPIGPFKWTLVREWIALGFVRDGCIRLEDSTEWVAVGNVDCLVSLPASLQKPDSAIMYYRSVGRTRFPSGPRQHSYLRSLGCPFDTSAFDKHLAWRVISQLEESFPNRASDAEREACEEELDRLFREAPATERQRAYLTSTGIRVSENLSKAEASQMVSPPSEGQLRRLAFYQIPLSRHLTKHDASELIDAYVREHPESEEKYQAWKQQNTSASIPSPDRKAWWKLW